MQKKTLLIFLFMISLTRVSLGEWTKIGPTGGQVSKIIKTSAWYYAIVGGSISRSTDGVTWNKIQANGLSIQTVVDLSAKNDTLYAGFFVGGGVYRSTDHGDNWVILSGTANVPIASIFCGDKAIYLGTQNNKIRRSPYTNISWTELSPNINMVAAISNIAVNGDTIFAASSTTTFGGLTRSYDGGTTWSAKLISGPVKTIKYKGHGQLLIGRSNGLLTSSNYGTATSTLLSAGIETIVNEGNHIYVGTTSGGVYFSEDGGTSWTITNTGLSNGPGTSPNLQIHSLLSDGNTLLAGTSKNGVFKSTNKGISWSVSSQGIFQTRVNHLISSSDNIFAATNLGIYKSSDNGNSWTPKNNGITAEVNTLAKNGSYLFASNYDLYRSADNGESWELLDTIITTSTLLNIIPKSLYVFNNIVFVSSNEGVFRSSDNGDSWTKLTTLTTAEQFINNGNTLFAGLYQGGVTRSTDNGDTWTAVNTGLTVPSTFIISLGTHKSTVFAGTNVTSFRSTDNGNNWTGAHIGPLTAYLSDGDILYATTKASIGLYYSTNGELGSWSLEQTGLPATEIANSILKHGDNIYIATTSNSIIRKKASDITLSIDNDIISDAGLMIYPNPVSGNLTIKSRQETINSIAIYNLAGYKVVEKPAVNTEQTTLDISPLSSGMYLVEINYSNNKKEVQRLVKH